MIQHIKDAIIIIQLQEIVFGKYQLAQLSLIWLFLTNYKVISNNQTKITNKIILIIKLKRIRKKKKRKKNVKSIRKEWQD